MAEQKSNLPQVQIHFSQAQLNECPVARSAAVAQLLSDLEKHGISHEPVTEGCGVVARAHLLPAEIMILKRQGFEIK